MIACDPHSASPSTRICGNAPPLPSPREDGGRPNRSTLACGVGEVQAEPVDAHQLPRSIEIPRHLRVRQRHHRLGVQHLQRFWPQTLPRLEQRSLGGDGPLLRPARRPGMSRHQHPHHLLVRRGGEQRQAEHVVHDNPSRQQAVPALDPATLVEDLDPPPRAEKPWSGHPARCDQTAADHSPASPILPVALTRITSVSF